MSEKEIQQIDGEIEQCLQTNDPFPVDFDDAWKWIGYSRKDNAKAALLSAGFVDGVDFQVFLETQENLKGGRPKEAIRLTNDCFKSFAMMAGTERGRQVRRYFIDCERRMKALIEERSKRRLTQEEIESLLVITGGTKWQKRFDDGFYELMSRLTGLPIGENGQRPMLFAQLTNEFVYDYMPKGIAAKLRQCREETGGWKKLHQFLTEDGLNTFNQHMEKLVTLMQAASSVNDLRNMLHRTCTEAYQLRLLDDNRKDGRLTLSHQAKIA